jgi:hypothetical protein
MGALGCLGIKAESKKLSVEVVDGRAVSAGSENMVPRWLMTTMSRSRMKSAAMSPLTSRGAMSPGPPAR